MRCGLQAVWVSDVLHVSAYCIPAPTGRVLLTDMLSACCRSETLRHLPACELLWSCR
jgi:hypothetical protein